MKNLAILAFALIVSGSAFAAEELTVAQMDAVSAGARNFIYQPNNQSISVSGSERTQVVAPNQQVAIVGNKGDVTVSQTTTAYQDNINYYY